MSIASSRTSTGRCCGSASSSSARRGSRRTSSPTTPKRSAPRVNQALHRGRRAVREGGGEVRQASTFRPTQRRQLNAAEARRSWSRRPPIQKEAEELTTIMASTATPTYGKGKWCKDPAKPETCLNIDEITNVHGDVARSRRAARGLGRLAHDFAADAQGLRALRRAVEQGREGARVSPTPARCGASKYDMPPDAFTQGARSAVGAGAAALPVAARLRAHEAAREVRRRRARRTGPIPAHLLGNIWAQDWANVYPLVAPAERRPGLLAHRDPAERRRSTPLDMVQYGERFYTSLGFAPLPQTFWERSLFVKPRDREVVCHASAWDIDAVNDLRIKMCIEPTAEDFSTIHHELGHNFYQRAYNTQPVALPRQRERRLPRGHRRHDRAVGHAGIPGEDRPARQGARRRRATSACC